MRRSTPGYPRAPNNLWAEVLTWQGMQHVMSCLGEDNGLHWIGLRENLQETMVFTIKYRAAGLSCKFSHHPILWSLQWEPLQVSPNSINFGQMVITHHQARFIPFLDQRLGFLKRPYLQPSSSKHWPEVEKRAGQPPLNGGSPRGQTRQQFAVGT